MADSWSSHTEEVELLLRNAQLRDEMEPFRDEAVELLTRRRLPILEENEFLASMLAWERAPVLPIGQWFNPPLELPKPEQLGENELHVVLWDVIFQLHAQRIVLRFTEHLSDRALYTLLLRDILPSPEKKVDLPGNFLVWYCLDAEDDCQTWLRYYATAEERDAWAESTGQALPPSELPPFPRELPQAV